MIVKRLCQTGCILWVLIALVACGTGNRDNIVRDSSDSLIPSDQADAGSSTASATPAVPSDTPSTQPQARDPEILFSTSFGDDSSASIFVGETSIGAQTSIVDGSYIVEVDNREWQTITVGPMPHLRNGTIQADIALDGSGLGGLVARSQTDADGNNWMYVCLIDESGWAGCVASHGDTFEDLFWAEVDGFAPGTTQRLAMSVFDDRVVLTVNGQPIGSAQDSSIQLGNWGVFAESLSDSLTTVQFDNLTISSTPPGAEPAEPLDGLERRSAHAAMSASG